MFLPEQDRLNYSKEQLESQISTLFGGRIAEAIIFGDEHVTTGASNDIQRATDLSRKMVTKWGLSARLGPLMYEEDDGEVFLGHQVTQHKMVSDETAHIIDKEVRALVDTNYARAEQLLRENISILHNMADALIKYETIDSAQLDILMEGKTLADIEEKKDDPSDNDDITKGEDASESNDTDEADTLKTKDGKIGGPASSH